MLSLFLLMIALDSEPGFELCFPENYDRLIGLDERITEDVLRLSCKYPVRVLEGLRTRERQKTLVSAGKSWTLKSRHLSGRAVDLYLESWELEPYVRLCRDWKRIRPTIRCGCAWNKHGFVLANQTICAVTGEACCYNYPEDPHCFFI